MSKEPEANAHGQPREGRPLMFRRRQVTHRQPQAAPQVTWTTVTPIPMDRPTLVPIRSQSPTRSCTRRRCQEGGKSVPRSSVPGPQRLEVSDLSTLHGPQLTLAPPRHLSALGSKASCANVKLPPLPAAAAAAASGCCGRGTARAVGPKATGQRELGPPSLWGTVAVGRGQGTASLESRTLEGLWRGSAARQGHHLPPLQPARGLPLRTGGQLAWMQLGYSETEELVELQERHGSYSNRDHFGGLSPYLSQNRPIMSTCTHEQSSVHQEVGAESLELPSASASSKDSGAEAGKCSELLSAAELTEQSCVSENWQPWDTCLKEREEKQEEEELPETEAAGDWDSPPQSTWLAPVKEHEVEAEASALPGDAWDEGQSKLLLKSEPEQTSSASASPLPGGPCEERASGQPAKYAPFPKQLCLGPDASIHPLRWKREELEKLEEDIMDAEEFGDIFSMGSEERPMMSSCILRDAANPPLEQVADPSVPQRACRATKGATGQTPNCSEFVSPDLWADLESDSDDSLCLESLLNDLLEKRRQEGMAGGKDREVESPLSLPLGDEELEPVLTPPDSDVSEEGHSEALPVALPKDPERLGVCASPADAVEEADAAGTEACHAQAAAPREKPCEAEPPAGPCPEPAQPLARSAPACPAGSAAVPQPPAPRRWRSVVKRARRALRRLFSFGCLRGQPEQ